MYSKVSERYGLNLTWEVVRSSQRPSSFFSCSLLHCHLNGFVFLTNTLVLEIFVMLMLIGECMVEAKDGKVSRMRCG